MPKIIKTVKTEGERYSLIFFCPGCKGHHGINQTWYFNGDFDKPTISPSILVNKNKSCSGEPICHSWIKEGVISFESDSTHELSGQKVELPDVDV